MSYFVTAIEVKYCFLKAVSFSQWRKRSEKKWITKRCDGHWPQKYLIWLATPSENIVIAKYIYLCDIAIFCTVEQTHAVGNWCQRTTTDDDLQIKQFTEMNRKGWQSSLLSVQNTSICCSYMGENYATFNTLPGSSDKSPLCLTPLWRPN